MALTGLQIQKLLPKTNCKECGSNTCLAFAMKLAAKKAELSLCPYASDEAKQVLGAASEPPVKAVALGPDGSVKLGEETVLYRHEKTFVNRTAFGVNIDDNSPTIDVTLASIRDYSMVRVGQTLTLDLVALTHKTSTPAAFAALATKAWKTAGKPLVLKSGSGVSPLGSQAQSRDGSATIDAALIAAAVAVKGSRSLLCPAAAPSDQLLAAARENGHALAITAPDLDSLAALADSLKTAGVADLILNFQTHTLAEQFQTNSIARRAALKDSFKP
ncbi:MAG: (Fe-S)-binding protein, partial [Tepidisphaerales bacterium]